MAWCCAGGGQPGQGDAVGFRCQEGWERAPHGAGWQQSLGLAGCAVGLDPSKRGECFPSTSARKGQNRHFVLISPSPVLTLLATFQGPAGAETLSALGQCMGDPASSPMGSVLFPKGHGWPLGPAASTAGSGSALARPLHGEMERPGAEACPKIALGLLQGPGLARGAGRRV